MSRHDLDQTENMVLRNRKRPATAPQIVSKSTIIASDAELPKIKIDPSSVSEPIRRSNSQPSQLQSNNNNSEDSVTSLTDTQHTSNRSSKNMAPEKLPLSLVLPRYTVAKWMILRGMGMMYVVVFLASIYQNYALFGTNGLQPASMEPLYRAFPNDRWRGFCQFLTIFWWIPFQDETLHVVEGLGLWVALMVGLAGINSWLLMAMLWILYFSIVTVASLGTSFYAYGWESQILETGFLCIFLCALPSWQYGWAWIEHSKMSQSVIRPTAINLWLFQWLMFRITTGAGLIKIRGSSCWTDKTCLYYHFETQPIPSPFSFGYHFLPKFIHRRMVDTDLMVQLYTAWMVLFPSCTEAWLPPRMERYVRMLVRTGGGLQAGFMIGIALSGNFSVLNHLTILPALACLDDSCWPCFLQTLASKHHIIEYMVVKARTNKHSNTEDDDDCNNDPKRYQAVPVSRRVIEALLLGLILMLSKPVVDNLLQRGGKNRQLMNASFDSFRIVNTYGAFGSVGKARYEPIIQISDDGITWHREIEFPCKPGDVYRRPCFCAPYHYRLDWNIWFIGFKPHRHYLQSRETWLFILLRKLLEPDENGTRQKRPWLNLLDQKTARELERTYYDMGKAPKYVKVDMYRYEMALPWWTIIQRKLRALVRYDLEEYRNVAWWQREFEEGLIQPISIESFQR
jgi:energy-coupling factor transporter transmembrane protein EcfT